MIRILSAIEGAPTLSSSSSVSNVALNPLCALNYIVKLAAKQFLRIISNVDVSVVVSESFPAPAKCTPKRA